MRVSGAVPISGERAPAGRPAVQPLPSAPASIGAGRHLADERARSGKGGGVAG